MKAFLRAARPRNFDQVTSLMAIALELFTPPECANYVRHCGYRILYRCEKRSFYLMRRSGSPGSARIQPEPVVSLEANQSITIGQDVEPLGVSLRVRQPRAALTDARVIPLIGRREAGEWAVGLSGFGVATRAIVFALLGWGIVVANWFRDASEVGTTASSVRILAHNREGWAARFSA